MNLTDRIDSIWSVAVKETDYVPRRLPWTYILWIVFIVCSVVGLYGLWLRYDQGHLPAGYGSYVPWGLWIACYFHGVGMSGGIFTLAALGYLFRWKGFNQPKDLRLAIVLSFASMLPAFLGVWLDLGHPMRFWEIFVTPSFTSMMAFNSWMYSGFMLVAALVWVLSYRADVFVWLKPLLCLGLFFSVLFPSQSGAFFGVVDAKGFWHSPLLPMMFLVSALTAGAALLFFARVLTDASSKTFMTTDTERADEHRIIGRLRLFIIAGILIYFTFEFAEFSISLWNPMSHAPAVDLMLWGPYWWVFWIVHLLIGGLVPLALLVWRWRPGWTIAAMLVAVCFLSARLNVLIPGQAVHEIKGLQEAFQAERLTFIYHATPMEYCVGLLLVAMGMAIYVTGRRINQIAGLFLPQILTKVSKS